MKKTLITLSVIFGVIILGIGIFLGVMEYQYTCAENLKENGEYAQAAISFGKMNGYKDSHKQSFACWDRVATRQTFDMSGNALVAIMEDGSVQARGLSAGDTSQWKNVVSVIQDDQYYTVGLMNDGTTVYSGTNPAGAQTATWDGIVAIASDSTQVIGLKQDGSVVANYTTINWNNMIAVDVGCVSNGGGTVYVGLKIDGTVVTHGDHNMDLSAVQKWTDIEAIGTANGLVAGVKKDGTVILSDDRYDVSLWKDIICVSVGTSHIVGLKKDGTVVATGSNIFGECQVAMWENIVAIDADGQKTTGLKGDGTLISTGRYVSTVADASSWTDIKTINAGNSFVTGIKNDGSVVVAGFNSFVEWGYDDVSAFLDADSVIPAMAQGLEYIGTIKDGQLNTYVWCPSPIEGWADIKKLCADRLTACLKNDGTVDVAYYDDGELVVGGIIGASAEETQIDTSRWSDIIDIDVGYGHIVGLRSDGTVVASGLNSSNQCDVTTWTDIIAINAGAAHTVGLKADGTVVTTSAIGDYRYAERCKVSSLEGIIAIAAAKQHTIILKSDGTVEAFIDDDYSFDGIELWRNIVAIDSGEEFVLGLRADGTVVVAGTYDEPGLDVSKFKSIKLPE